MISAIDHKGTHIPRQSVVKLVSALRAQIEPSVLAAEVGDEALRAFESSEQDVTYRAVWPLLRLAYRRGLLDLIPAHDIPPVPYDLRKDVQNPNTLLNLKPLGFEQKFSTSPLREMRTQIAGHWVDFPLGLPASILAAHADWIEFFATRGFCILTYKTVRPRRWDAHPLPNWVFVEDVASRTAEGSLTYHGSPDYWPTDISRVSMANSFGIPSFEPEQWEADLGKARQIVREGHQVLIASIVSSAQGETDIIDDFAGAALRAKRAGADIIELNYSCPNTQGEIAGDLYHDYKEAARISKAVREALGTTPVFVKIGYLAQPKLAELVFAIAPHVDGIVGINTISAKVWRPDGNQTFPDRVTETGKVIPREIAGISGFAIQAEASEVASNLAKLKKEVLAQFGKNLVLLSVGGVLNVQDFYNRLSTGVDGVEICTGAFLNPHIGLEIRTASGNQGSMEEDNPHDARPGAARRAGTAGATSTSEGGAMNVDTQAIRPKIAVEFTTKSDFDRGLQIYIEEKPSGYFAAPEPYTLVILRRDLEWFEARLQSEDRQYKIVRVRSFAEASPDERAELRSRGHRRFG